MARAGPKRHGPKPPKAPSTSTAGQPPKPFTLAPAKLSEFLETLPKDGLYLTHIDRTPIEEKRQLFMGPVVLNLVFTVVMVIRLYFAVPGYMALVSAFMGLESEARIDTQNTPTSDLITILLQRVGGMIIDYSLYSLLGRWVVRFILEEVAWRWSVGFQKEEVVVRVSKKWHKDLKQKWTSENEKVIADKVLEAMDEYRLQKSALRLSDPFFILDTQAMVAAHQLIDRGDVTLEDFDRYCLVHYQPIEGWIMWKLAEDKPVISKDQDENLTKFRNILLSKDKEDLFYRYIEIVQYEATLAGYQKGGYQKKAWEECVKAFNEQGVSLSQIREQMGGMKNMPFIGEDL